MRKKVTSKKKSSFRAGIYLLENLTSGMYNDPLSIYREYIQNAVDSIDIGLTNGHKDSLSVHIDLDPFKRQIMIRDNGAGISSDIAEEVLSSIGCSNKSDKSLRGFRGIGRLGGVAFCDKAIFRTKARGEVVESEQVWDCLKLRHLIDTKRTSLSFKDFFETVTAFSQHNGQRRKDSYFEVTLEVLSSFKNHVFDIETLSTYLGQVAPVPFDNINFPFGDDIDKYLKNNFDSYNFYDIYLNDKIVFKPYRSIIKTTVKKGGQDSIEDICFFKIKGKKEEYLAYGWYGHRKNLLGSIKRCEGYSGIRVRVGNILIGDAHLLDRCFREERFNSYMIGEIHVTSPELIPNSRRDDFVDNETKALFYNAVEKEIGLPVSKEIRLMSRSNSNNIKTNIQKKIELNNNSNNVNKKSNTNNAAQYNNIDVKIKSICGNCHKLHKILEITKLI